MAKHRGKSDRDVLVGAMGTGMSVAFRGRMVEMVPISALKPRARNARTHSKRQIRQIALSIERFGFVNPVLIDIDGVIIAGHGRFDAAKLLGLTEVPTLRIDHLSEVEKQAYVIADNRIAELAGWDREILAIELQDLVGLGFEVEVTGFETAEIDLRIGEHNAAASDEPGPEDVVPASLSGRTIVSRIGDLWALGDHSLACGDARDGEIYRRLVDGEAVRMAITDPPYNVPIAGHVSGLGKRTHREFEMAFGEMTRPAFTSFLETVCRNMAAVSMLGALHYVFTDWRHLQEMLTAGHAVFDDLINLCVWDKGAGAMGSFYRSRHEIVLVWKTGTGPHLNLIELGRHGRNRTNVWNYRGMNSFGRERDAMLEMHPTTKPAALIADAILDCTRRRDLVLDPFCGSGTILIAAQKTGRRARAIEIDPAYCDTAIRRWQTYTGQWAVHAATGLSFEDTEERRARDEAGESGR